MEQYSNPTGSNVFRDGIPGYAPGLLGFWLGNFPVRDRYLVRI